MDFKAVLGRSGSTTRSTVVVAAYHEIKTFSFKSIDKGSGHSFANQYCLF